MRIATPAFAASLLTLGACTPADSTFRAGHEFDTTKVSEFKTGVTTAGDVQTKLGPPLNILKEGSKETWTYQFIDSRATQSKAQRDAQMKTFALGMIPFVGGVVAVSNLPSMTSARPDTTSTSRVLSVQFTGGVMTGCTLLTSSSANDQSQTERYTCT